MTLFKTNWFIEVNIILTDTGIHIINNNISCKKWKKFINKSPHRFSKMAFVQNTYFLRIYTILNHQMKLRNVYFRYSIQSFIYLLNHTDEAPHEHNEVPRAYQF